VLSAAEKDKKSDKDTRLTLPREFTPTALRPEEG